jgi:hypothetical protein
MPTVRPGPSCAQTPTGAWLWDHGGMAEGTHDDTDVVTVRLPGDSAYASIGRTAAMALGLRAGFDWPTLTALALAVDETMVMLLGPAGPAPHPDDTLELVFTVGSGQLALAVGADGSGPPIDPAGPALERFATLMDGFPGSWSVDPAANLVEITVTGPGPTPPGPPPPGSTPTDPAG